MNADAIFDAGARFSSDPATAPVVIAGVQVRQGAWAPNATPQRQLVLLPKAFVAQVSDDVVIAGVDAVHARKDFVEAATREAAAIRGFVEAELDFPLSGRLVVLSDARVETMACARGTITPGDAIFAGTATGDLRLLAIFGVDDIATAWWGCGIRVGSRLGAAVELAIVYALALRRQALLNNPAYVRLLREWLDERRAEAPSTMAAGTLAEVDFCPRLAGAIFDESLRSPAVLAELRAMTRAYWGKTVSAHEVVARLAAAGVTIPPIPPILREPQ